MENKTAILVKKDCGDFAGDARLYRLEPAFIHEEYDYASEKFIEKFYEYVVVSAARVIYSGPETYIFPANEEGEVTTWSELPGSYRGGLNHQIALEGMGYSSDD